MASMQGAEKAKSLLSTLASDLQENKLSDSERTKLLSELKVIGRNPAQASPIFAKDSTSTLCRYAFETSTSSASREAMRCLANAMLLNEPTRQTILDLGCAPKAAERMKTDDRDDEFLTSRILFFSTYTAKLDIPTLFEKHSLAESITSNLERAVKRLEAGTPSTPITDLAFQETLKLIYNLTYYSPDSATSLQPALTPLATLLIKTPLPTPPLQPPITHLINALLNLNPSPSQIEDSTLRDPFFPPHSPTLLTTHFTSLLEASFPQTPSATDDPLLSPLLSLLRTLHATAPQKVQQSLRTTLLPSETSRSQPLGKDPSLPSRLLRTAASPSTSTLRDIASALLFELSSSSAQELIQNIGYGYAIGILTRLGVDAPPSALAGTGSSDAMGSGEGGVGGEGGQGAGRGGVNPVTGQRLDAERTTEDMERVQREIDGMTEEEKEREAERLFVLFERLKATGVVDVVNPVEMMMRNQEGGAGQRPGRGGRETRGRVEEVDE
ncbi:guanine nucleotide exchange factor [Elsinoe ampelina]|uniref:Guanine nucleotide exchange factor n=1 Tax=Elsinoe ampelina TaxID=302913 RepID=A0A6A6GDU6_9PEZI|nr:guanine nucleotide exchange factor [Elsinoe ampelina]